MDRSGLRITVQFNTKIFYPRKDNKPSLWSSDPLSNVDFSEDKCSLYADDCAVELSEDGNTYSIKSATNKNSIVNMTMTRQTPGFAIGKDGTTTYGTDPEQPWGSMRHVFWPRTRVEGTIVTEEGTVDLKGTGSYIMCLQGMKPHHAAARWNFANFQGPEYTAIMMEYTTPPSYGSTVVNVGAIIKGDQIISTGASNTATHSKVKGDTVNDWPEPEEVKLVWNGKTQDGKPVQAVFDGPLNERRDRVDVMAEVPGFIKTIIKAAAGTKPYIYQVSRLPGASSLANYPSTSPTSPR